MRPAPRTHRPSTLHTDFQQNRTIRGWVSDLTTSNLGTVRHLGFDRKWILGILRAASDRIPYPIIPHLVQIDPQFRIREMKCVNTTLYNGGRRRLIISGYRFDTYLSMHASFQHNRAKHGRVNVCDLTNFPGPFYRGGAPNKPLILGWS